MKNKDTASLTYRLEKTGSGYPTLIVNYGGKDTPLHSTVNPLSEAERFASRYDPGRYDFLVILGAAFGYHLLSLKDIISGYKKVVIIDFISDAADILKQNPLAGFIFDSSEIMILSGVSPEKVSDILETEIDFDSIRGISLVEHPPSVRISPGYYNTVADALSGIIDSKSSNAATIKRFAMRYVSNIIKNLENTGSFYPVSDLFGLFKGHKAAVIASGPSLYNYTGIIKDMKDSVFIICVDSALSVLKRSEVTPDIMVSIDPQAYVTEHLERDPGDETLKLFSISSHYARSSEYGGFLSLNSHPLSQVMEKFSSGNSGSIDSGTGSVAGDALNLALKCGFETIYLFGFDFSFSDYNIYSRGTSYQKRYSQYFNNRFMTQETLNLNYIMRASGSVKKDNRFTRRSFINYKEKMEKLIKDSNHPRIFNINSAGLPIEGTARKDSAGISHSSSDINKEKMKKSIQSRSTALNKTVSIPDIKKFITNRQISDQLAAESGCAHKKEIFYKKISSLRE